MIKGVDYTGIAVVPISHDGKGKYLLGKRTDKCRDEHNRWEPTGGGGVEVGEELESALVRELKEEIGATPFNIEYLGMRQVFREHDGKKTHWIAFDYRVQVDPNEVKIMEPDMCSELSWFALGDFPEPQHSQFPIFLEKYKDQL